MIPLPPETELPGWFDFAALYDEAVAAALPGDTLVEVGVWHGRSLVYLAKAARASGKGLRLYGVDHFLGDPDTGPAPLGLGARCVCNFLDAGFTIGGDTVKLIISDSVRAAKRFSDASLGFVFLDASHDYASVRSDLRAWLPKVRPGGTLAGHDYLAPGVARAVAELLPGYVRRESCWLFQKPLRDQSPIRPDPAAVESADHGPSSARAAGPDAQSLP